MLIICSWTEKKAAGNSKSIQMRRKKYSMCFLAEDGDIDSVLKAEDASTEKTTEAATEDTEDSSKSITIEIQNSTKISGLASRWKDKLTEDGLQHWIGQDKPAGRADSYKDHHCGKRSGSGSEELF